MYGSPESSVDMQIKKAQKVSGSKGSMILSLRVTVRGKSSPMEVVEDFESRPHKAVSFLVESEKEMQEWNEQKLPTALPGYSGGRLPGRSTKEKGGEEGEAEEEGRDTSQE